MAHIDTRINATEVDREAAKAHLDDCLALAGDCHAIYMSIDDSLRRIANQAFFEHTYVSEIDTIDRELAEPFDALFNPAVQAEALDRQATQAAGSEAPDRSSHVEGLNKRTPGGPGGIRTPDIRGVSAAL